MVWSEYWGDAYWGGAPLVTYESTAIDRILMFTRGPRFRAFAGALGRRADELAAAIETIGVSFALDTAVGVQLTRLGEILQKPRDGMDDELYRRVLRAWIDIVLSSQGSTDTLFAVVRAITGLAAPEYAEFYPKTFVIGAYVDPDEIGVLAELIRQAKDWGTNGSLVAYPPGSAPGEGGVLLGDLAADEGLWSLVTADQTFQCVMTDDAQGAVDAVDGEAPTVFAGTTYNATFESRNFNGSTDGIQFASQLDMTSQLCTIAAWVRWETLSGLRVIFNVASAANAQSLILRTNGSSLEISRAYSPGTSMQRISTAVLATAAWTHVAAVYDPNDVAADSRLYINGVEAAYSSTIDGSGTQRAADGTWAIGRRVEVSTNSTDGDITDVRVWPRHLGPEEIWHLYEEAVISGAFAGPPDDDPVVDNPGVADSVTEGPYALAYPTATLVTV